METQVNTLVKKARDRLNEKHYAERTAELYLGWIKRYIKYLGNKQPDAMDGREIRKFLKHLVRHHHASPSTQHQAYCALALLYEDVLGKKVKPF
jgi:site-specific recombinase XerD